MSIESVEYKAAPSDSRCRYWCKVIRADEPLPLPADVERANDIPGNYRQGPEELFPGDIVLEGEENHHRKQRGWSYNVGLCVGREISWNPRGNETKPWLRERGLRDLLKGSGQIAAIVREAHALRLRAAEPSNRDVQAIVSAAIAGMPTA